MKEYKVRWDSRRGTRESTEFSEEFYGQYASNHAHEFALSRDDSSIQVREVGEWEEIDINRDEAQVVTDAKARSKAKYEEEVARLPVPVVGQDVYISTSLYLSHGMDDFHGGLCRISNISEGVSAGVKVPFIEVEENPGTRHNWKVVCEEQDKLRERFGDQRGYADPDERPEFNRWD